MRVKGGNDYLSLVNIYIPSYYEGCVVFVIVNIHYPSYLYIDTLDLQTCKLY